MVNRDISDNKPIWIKGNHIDWGSKLFKISNAWLDHKDFIPFVSSVWNSFSVKGREDFILKEKLKLLKEALRKWNKEVFGFLDLEVDKAVSFANKLELLEEGGIVDNVDLFSKDLYEANFKMWQTLNYRESILHQRSRHKCIKEGDCNTIFFTKS